MNTGGVRTGRGAALPWIAAMGMWAVFMAGIAASAERCSHVYSFLGVTEGTSTCLWIGEQTTGDCGARPRGFRLHQVLIRAGGTEVLSSRLRDEYPDWVQLESWLAKSGTLKARRFEWLDNDWKLDLGSGTLVLLPGRGSRPPGVVNRRTQVLKRVTAGPGGEIIHRAWLLPGPDLIVVLTRAAGPEDSILEGYCVLKMSAPRP